MKLSASSTCVVAASLCRGVHRVMPSTATQRRGYSATRFLFLLFLLSLCPAFPLHAQIGNNNPTGVSGIFNGNVLEYDPYTGNAGPRSTTDITVAGGVGAYPLALVRSYNSRDAIGIHFGYSGWRHSYEWTIDPSGNLPGSNTPPAAYVVNFPDGRRETFRFVDWDCGVYPCYYRVTPGGVQQSSGVRERFQQLNMSNLLCYLILPDGGKVKFLATRHNAQNNYYYYTYRVQAIIDPYGQETTITWGGNWRISRVTEPAGRYIQFYYRTDPNSQIIDHVIGSDGRRVQYNYINSAYSPGTFHYMELDNVVYYNNPQWTARYKYRAPNVGGANSVPLLWTADDPMYSGVMKRIAYEYKTGSNQDGTPPAYGQIYRVRYYDGNPNNAGTGVPVSTLAVTARNIRVETRGDNKTRTFTYGTGNLDGYLQSCTDFMNHNASQTYDAKRYINSVMDFNGNGHRTDYTLNAVTGNVTQMQFPATADVTPSPAPRGTISYTYGAPSCHDPNNQDANNPYYVCTATDEDGHVTKYWRDAYHRITQIDYPDGGYETFAYDPAHFYQLNSHRMITGGTETFTYNGRAGLKDTYRNPDNPNGNPTVRYYYDALDRVSGIYDALDHPTNWEYNDRGQLTKTTLAPDSVDNQRHWITSAYNPDGTLQSRTDERGQVTRYEYDDYRRLKSVTPPVRGYGDTGQHMTRYFYDANGTLDDYKYTDSNVTWVTLSSGKRIKTIYDDNRRKDSVTVAPGTPDAATTSYAYDNVGNLRTVTNPLNHNNVSTLYDERNRPSSVSVGGQTTTFTYDTAGRKKIIERPNGQVVTNVSFDVMNRLTRQDATNAGTTKYTYHPGSGLLYTMQDPRLVALGRDPDQYAYTYLYDPMGRKSVVGYPPDSDGLRTFEAYIYDSSGRLYTYMNRNGKTQTFTYDALNRLSYFTWNDTNPNTPRVDFGYDAASRLTGITNANATISRGYFNDNRLRTETETATGGAARTVNYTYDADGNRATLQIPGYSFTYDYTGRNQLKNIKQNGTTLASYVYDLMGNITSRTLNNGTHTEYPYYDPLDRVGWVVHYLNGTTRSFNYGYYDDSNNRKYTRRLYANQDAGDVFSYDLADQVIGVQLDVDQPQNVGTIEQTINYEANGNRTLFSPYEWLEAYTVNDLSQYTGRLVHELDDPRPSPTPRSRPTPYPRPTPPGQQSAAYDYAGNMTTGFDGSICTYDAQNRLLSVTKDGVTMAFKYDGLNRQVSRIVGSSTTYSVWDGWDLVHEYHGQGIVDASYLYGATGLVKNLTTSRYYYQDGSGSTSHLANSSGQLLEWYWYDLQGMPCILDANNNQRTTSAYGVRHLFTGQQWYSEIGLYDLRNRFYSPDIGRFLQPDPTGFNGDPTNLYRYCGNNPVTYGDPSGEYAVYKAAGGYWYYIVNPGYESYIGTSVGPHGWCAEGAQILSGGYLFGSTYHDMPKTAYWRQGAPLTSAIGPGTVVARGWVNSQYPQISPDRYLEQYGGPLYHTGIFLGLLNGEALILEQSEGDVLHVSGYSLDRLRQEGWSEVRVSQRNGPYASGTSSDPNARGGGAPLTKDQQARITGLLGLASRFNPYWGYLPTTFTTNFAGGIAGLDFGGGSPWDLRNQQSVGGTPNFAPPYGGNIVVGGEPGLGCFAAGTAILMADGSEKSIESIEVGEAVLAWNEENKKMFFTKVVSALHHEEKMQSLFDMELDDGRTFTVNNNHPMYVVEDGDFKFTDELAGRFARGEPITFQDNNDHPVKIAGLRMRRQACKVYNLHVEGQGNKGHTFYASGILVHNAGAGFRHK
jgi:RHS repeat-associated protein